MMESTLNNKKDSTIMEIFENFQNTHFKGISERLNLILMGAESWLKEMQIYLLVLVDSAVN